MIVTRRRFSLGFATLPLALGGCKKDTSGEIVIGAYLSLSGADSTFGVDTRDGIELALAGANAAGGVKGKRLRVLYEDDKSSTTEATQKVRQLIDRDKVVALLGEVSSSRSIAGGLIANTSKVPMISPSATAVEVTKDRPWVFRTCYTDDQQGEVAARFVKNELKKAKVGIFYAAQDTYSTGLARSFREELKRLGGVIVVDKGYQKGETNFRTHLAELKAREPELVFAPNYYSEIVLLARQAKELDIPGSTFFGGDAWDSSNLVEGAGAELEGAHFTNAFAADVPWPGSKRFVEAYRAAHRREPSSMAAQGYDAACILFDAIGRASAVEPEAIRSALAATKDFSGATGTMSFDAERNANKPIVIVEIKNKKLTYKTQMLSGVR